MAKQSVQIDESGTLPLWRRPISQLLLMAFGMPIAFSVWGAMLNNFAVEMASFDGSDIGWLHTIREIPGFMAFAVIYVLLFIREQNLAIFSLLLLGVSVAVTGYFPSFWGLALTTIIGSIGFHYYETVNQSLQLQWIEKSRAPQVIGWIVAAGSFGSLLAYGAIVAAWKAYDLDFNIVYLFAGAILVLIAIFCAVAYPKFETRNVQHKGIILRGRYWLYYALTFMGGARRQIFMVFAGFMMVEKFGFAVHEIAGLYLLNYLANMAFAPLAGWVITRFGERAAMTFEYLGLIVIFGAYAVVQDPMVAAILYILDHLFFAMAFAQKTYFQKIADPRDIAPSAAVAFTINHIAAVFLPALLGYLWLVSPGAVFWIGAAMAFISLVLARLVPRHPNEGAETILKRV